MLVIPSFDEGFGIPALEAMTIGVPVVAASRGALPEVVGDAGLLVKIEDPGALSAAMEKVMTDAGLRRRLADAGVRRAAQFSWDTSAGRLYDAYRAAVRATSISAASWWDRVTRPLRIGVDARELLGDTTGVGRYLGELMRRWTARADSARRRFVLYAPEPLPLAFPEGIG